MEVKVQEIRILRERCSYRNDSRIADTIVCADHERLRISRADAREMLISVRAVLRSNSLARATAVLSPSSNSEKSLSLETGSSMEAGS